jgi:hypothetical protein
MRQETTQMATRGKQRISILPLAARTTTQTSRSYTTPYHNGIILSLYATALAATPSIVMKIQGWDVDGAGTWTDLLADAAVTTAAPTASDLKLYPGAITAANVALDRPLPSKWRVVVTHGDADSITYKVFATIFPA